MEGKKSRVLYPDCRAVSEVYGQLLMMSIVVIAFSTIAVTVFSDEGVVKPEHIPHTNLQENFNLSNNKIQIIHSGGEAIDKSAIKVKLSVKIPGDPKLYHPEFSGSKLHLNLEDNVFALGDSILIYTADPNNKTEYVNITNDADVDMYFIDTPSQQVIHTAVLQRGSEGVPDWITPHPYGTFYRDSVENKGWQPTESVAEKDGICTNSSIPSGAQVTEKYTFGIDVGEMGISNSFNSVLLSIIYQVTGNVSGTPVLSISTNGAEGTPIAPNVTYSDASSTTYDYNITPYVKTASELEQLQVIFSAEGQTNGTLGVDFVGIQVK